MSWQAFAVLPGCQIGIDSKRQFVRIRRYQTRIRGETAKDRPHRRGAQRDGHVKIEEAMTGQRIPLDLTPSLLGVGKFDRLLYRIEGVPYGASISAGRSDGDRNWSVPAANIAGLCYIPANPDFEPHGLYVRVVGADDDEAVVIYQFDLEIRPGSQVPVVRTYNTSSGEAPEPQGQFTGTAAEGDPDPADLLLADNGTTALQGKVADLTQRLELAEAQIMEIRGIATAAVARLAAVEAQVKDDPNHTNGAPGGGPRPAIRVVPVQA